MATDPKENSLLQKMSSEVAPEVSPLLQALLNNSKLIGIVLAVCVLGAAAYGGWRWHEAKSISEAQAELGRILILPAPADREAKLKTFLASAPEGMKAAGNLALAQAALEAKNYAAAVGAWDAVARDSQSPLYATAMIGKAEALALQGKDAEAVAILETVKASAEKNAKSLVESMIVDLAEKAGDYTKALASCDALINTTSNPMEVEFWRQKAASLRLRQGEAKKPS